MKIFKKSNIVWDSLLESTNEYPLLHYNYNNVGFFKDGRFYNNPEIKLFKINNATIFSNGIIYSGAKFVTESTVLPLFIPQYNTQYLLINLLKKKRYRLPLTTKYLAVVDEWSHGHYHFITELLPKLLAIKEQLPEFTLLLPGTSYIKNVGIKLITEAGIKFKDVLFMNNGYRYEANEVYYVSRTTNSGSCNSILIKGLKEELNKNTQLELPEERIYNTRKNANRRKILNEDEVCSFLATKYNFKIVDFDGLNIEEQRMVSSKAKVMLGIHGAGLTNCIFMQKDSLLIEFRRDGPHHNHCYWHLASAADLHYHCFFGTPDGDGVLEGNGVNLTIDINKLEKFLIPLLK